MTEPTVVSPDDFMDLLRQEHANPFVHPSQPQPQNKPTEDYTEAYAALRREFDADLYGRVSLKRIASLSR
ncbi:hypothetical protein BLA23254_05015 [Burkholderia lata]|uniref:Uncharacterized protein n=1 Tax=Burkholderia lata (strain ATCC 17760 / DSM 23089 / LMG 22485 / NCIMB 9086 / R18194 / 383) TaxID=482957 RepID=A0A6P2PCL1_BURL3|nr:hypothetical protein [Burkholderia lata]VWC05435.1 hypothetical protein BLA23254_05015 [Burkholderia lata]